MILTIAYEVPSQNVRDRWHWCKRHRDRDRARALIRAACLAQGIYRGPPPAGLVTLHLMAYRKQRCKDISNLIGGAKGLVDALVAEGLLVDDSDQHVKIQYDQGTASQSPTRRPCTVVVWRDEGWLDNCPPTAPGSARTPAGWSATAAGPSTAGIISTLEDGPRAGAGTHD